MRSGQHSSYYWVEWFGPILSELLSRLPDIVLGRHLVNTSFDSGSLWPSEEEERQGWRKVGPLTYSPRITERTIIPHDRFDEWLVFSEPTQLQSWEPVINYLEFSLGDPGFEWIHGKLWPQIESIRPESYLGEGHWLIFITQDARLYQRALGLDLKEQTN